MLYLFKGFVPTDSNLPKKPKISFKEGSTLYDFSGVSHLDSYAGILDEKYIQIDFDDNAEFNLVLDIVNKLKINTAALRSSRGGHLYFLRPLSETNRKQGRYTPIGVKVDVGVGNKPTAIPLKINGNLREWICTSDNLDMLPAWLTPFDNKKTVVNFKDLQEGDGRNDTLFTYILTLQRESLTKDEIKQTIRIINDFILKEPIATNELDTILRDEAFLKETFYEKNKLNYKRFIEYLLKECHAISLNESLFIYKDGVYTDNKFLIKRSIDNILNNISTRDLNETISRLEIKAPIIDKLSLPNKIVVNNGLLDIESLSLDSFTPNYICTNKIPVNYNPAAYSKDLDKALNDICCNDPNLRLVIEEMFGSTLYRSNQFNKLFILNGSGANGKSTLLDLMRSMIGESNVSSISLHDFFKSQFKPYQVNYKLANIGDDISGDVVNGSEILKKLVTGEKLNVERKGKDPFDINNYASMFFSSNHPVIINDTTHGMERRVMNIPFNASFRGPNADYSIIDRCREGDIEFLEYMLLLSLQGLQRLLKNKKYTKCKAVDDANKQFKYNNNPELLFIEEAKIENESVNDVYLQYQTWCIEEGISTKPVKSNSLSRMIKTYGYTQVRRTINGKKLYIWTKSD